MSVCVRVRVCDACLCMRECVCVCKIVTDV